jgi:hypothetical protein
MTQATLLLLPLLPLTVACVGGVQPEVRFPAIVFKYSYEVTKTFPLTDLPVDGIKKRKKRNRWGDAQENKAAGLMGLPTMIMANFTNEQLEAYTLHLRIEEISQKLRINDVVPADGDRWAESKYLNLVLTIYPNYFLSSRSPSPPPQYDNFGRRVNTREYRYRKRLEDERHKLVEKAMKVIPNYHPPSDYRRPTKTQEKVYVPVNDYPEINFSMITNPLTTLEIPALIFLAFLSILLDKSLKRHRNDNDVGSGSLKTNPLFLSYSHSLYSSFWTDDT